MSASDRQTAILRALGRMEGLLSELGLLKSWLEAAPAWLPSAGLARQCDEARRMIGSIAARIERSLVVTVIGPSGSGKSTLVNALAGGDELSATGHRRPTTGRLIVLGGSGEDAAHISRELGGDSVDIRTARAGTFPADLCLIDTPDTDSMEHRRHIPILERAIEHSDILICVFDAENPKRRDHVDFLAPFIRRFDGESLVAVLNKCDRLEEGELRTSILPDFQAYLRVAWRGAVDRTLCLCARRHLDDPAWDPEAGPRHEFDQFAELRNLVLGASGRGHFAIDRRVDNARQLHAWVTEEAARQIAADREALEAARLGIAGIETEAVQSAASALRSAPIAVGAGLGIVVYQKLCQKWVGPLGWMLAVWVRLLTLGTGLAGFFRRKAGRASEGQESRALAADQLDAVRRSYRMGILKRWPEVAEMLTRGRFDPAAPGLEAAAESAERAAEHLYALWTDCVEREIERISGRLGGFWLQVLLNAPVVGILTYVGWNTLTSFFRADYLSGDYFLHAFWVIAIVLLLSFFGLQTVIRLAAGSERILSRTCDRLETEVQTFEPPDRHPVRLQLGKLLRLAEAVSPEGPVPLIRPEGENLTVRTRPMAHA